MCHSPGPYLYTLLVSNLWCVTVQDPTCILYWYQTSGVSQYRALPVYFIGIKPLVCHSPGPYLYTLLVSNLWCVTVQDPTCILYWYQTSGVSQSRTLPVYFIGIKPLVCHSPGPYLYTLLVSNLWCVTVQDPTCILYWYQTSGVSQSRTLPVYFIGIKPLVCHSPGPYLYTLLVSNLWCVTVQDPTCILYWYQTSGVSQYRTLPVYFIGIKPLVCHSTGPYLYTLLVSKPLVCHSPGPYLYTLLVSKPLVCHSTGPYLYTLLVSKPLVCHSPGPYLYTLLVSKPLVCHSTGPYLYTLLVSKPLVCHSPGPYLYTLLVSKPLVCHSTGPYLYTLWVSKPLVCHSPGPYLYTLLVSNLWCVTVQDPTCILYWYQTSGVSQSRALPVYFIGIKPLMCHSPGPYLYTLWVSKPLVCHSPGPYLYTLLVSNLWCVTVQDPTCILYWYQTSGVSQSRTLPVYFMGL